MMNAEIPILKILIVEDEELTIDAWKDEIEKHNSDRERLGFTIEYVVAKNVADAKRELSLHRFDSAVIDLRLQSNTKGSEHNSDGNTLISHIQNTFPMGVVVLTGQPSEVEHAKGFPQITVITKGGSFSEVFAWISEHKNVFLKLRGAKAAFNRETAKIFFKSIWPRWKHWNAGFASTDNTSEVVARHIVAHVHDILLASDGGKAHSEEAYFVPPLKDRLDTGDILEYEDQIWVVVSPRCDLAHESKSETVLLAFCKDISAEWRDVTADCQKPEKKKKSENRRNHLIQHEKSPKQHFLYPLSDIEGKPRGPWLAQFHHIASIPSKEAIQSFPAKRIASLSPLFIPSLVERLGAYFSRIGSPDYMVDSSTHIISCETEQTIQCRS